MNTIIETKNNYVVSVKRNAKKLYSLIEYASVRLTDSIGYLKTKDKKHGREETRTIHVFKATEKIREYMPHIQTIARVVRIRQYRGNTSMNLAYYISNLELTARKLNKGIRNHWSIENKLHWVKDVVMNEDNSCQKHKQLAVYFSTIRSIVISIGYLNSDSVTNFQRTFSCNIELMRLLLE